MRVYANRGRFDYTSIEWNSHQFLEFHDRDCRREVLFNEMVYELNACAIDRLREYEELI